MMNDSTLELAKAIRLDSLRMVHRARASHIGSALSISDIVAVLYERILVLCTGNPKWSLRDRFILSKGHACVAIYAALAAKGFITREDLSTYGDDFSSLMNHISHKVPGVEFSTGSLGHGLPFGVGKAIAAKARSEPWRTFVLLSDGELGEGSNWEASLFASHHRLDNLIVIIDYNNLQSLTSVDKTLALEPIGSKFAAFGWDVREVDGHNHSQLSDVLATAPWSKGKPSIVIARTLKGKGVSFMEGRVEWHYRNPDDLQLEAAIREISEQ